MTAEDARENHAPWQLESRSMFVLFAASAIGLWLELALIRWVSSEVRVFAYCKNLVLVAAFLGFGAGLLRWRSGLDLVGSHFLLLLLTLVVRLPWQAIEHFGPRRVGLILPELSSFMMFRSWDQEVAWGLATKVAFSIGWTTALFFAIAAVMMPFGQLVGAAMARVASPLRAYTVNVAASLAGILAYTGATALWLPPSSWFVPPVVACALLSAGGRTRRSLIGIALALLLVLAPDDGDGLVEYWSSYQKLALLRGDYVVVNNQGYQRMERVPEMPPAGEIPVTRLNLPYALRRPPGRVLVVGAGTGNDAAAALLAGARSVTAVDIDPVIVSIGRQHHPQRPCDDPRVELVIDDARHFLKTTRRRYDLIVFSHLDSHTVLSSYTSVRLDNYVYTVEAFREARARLAEHGLLYVSYWSEQPFIPARLSRNLETAFGHAPVALEGKRPYETRQGWRQVYFLTGEASLLPEIEAATSRWAADFRRLDLGRDPTPPSTDEWPFLPLERPSVPGVMLLISGAIVALAAAFAWRLRPQGERFDARLFWMGAAFLLLEVHNVSRLALVFGTTWQVNAWVISAILTVILAANSTVAKLARSQGPPRWAVAGLFASLALAFLAPVGTLASGIPLGGPAAIALLTAPIYFAGVVFADAFVRSPAPSFALGWNVLGAVVGGLTENLGYLVGIPALVLVAAGFYALALFGPRAEAAR